MDTSVTALGSCALRLEQAKPRPGEALIGVIAPGRSYCRLPIEGNGTGILPDVLLRVFEPFVTTKDPSARRRPGTGRVHGVVQSHHAVCHVCSEVERGTVFSIYFLRETEAGDRPAAHEYARPATASPGGERVLVVDDNPNITDALTIGFELHGFQVTGISDPLLAYHLCGGSKGVRCGH